MSKKMQKIELVNGIPTVTYKPWQSWYLRVPILRNICSWYILRRLPKIVMGEPIRVNAGKDTTQKIGKLLPKSKQPPRQPEENP